MGVRSFGTTPRMELSLEPSISQLAIVSQSAMWCVSASRFFSSIVVGRSQPSTAASTGQNRFCGCP